MTTKLILTKLALVAALSVASAGDTYVPFDAKAPADACPSYSHSLSMGYDSDYIWRGLQRADETLWGAANLDLGNGFSVGAKYLEGLPGGYEEFNAYAAYALPQILGFDASLGYRFYDFFDAANEEHEASLSLSRDFLGATLGLFTAFGFENDTWFHQASLDRELNVGGVALNLGSAIGYWGGRGVASDGFGFTQTKLSTDIPVGCRVVLTPYVGYINSLPGGPTHPSDTQWGGISPGDKFFGGISGSYAF